MAAQVVQAPPESESPLAQFATHTLFWLLVCEHPLTVSASEQDEQTVHVVASAR